MKALIMERQLGKRKIVSASFWSVLLLAFPLLLVAISPSLLHAQDNGIRCIEPGAGERYLSGNEYEITWNSTLDSGTVRILLWNGIEGSWNTIATGVEASQESYHWTVDPTLQGDLFRIKIEAEGGADHDMTESYFLIQEPGEEEEEVAPRLEVHPAIMPETLPLTLMVKPNPAASIVEVQTDGSPLSSVTLQDLQGKGVRVPITDLESGDHAAIRVEHLPNGVYFIEACGNDGRCAVKKFVVRH
jgi:hypothetical protein